MSRYLISVLILMFPFVGHAQFELPNNSVIINSSDKGVNRPTGFEMPDIKTPTISNIKNPRPSDSELGKQEEREFDMQQGDGLMEYSGTNKAPRAFTKDKEAKPEYGKDMYLGDVKTNSKFVTIQYRDHQFVDGDRVRIYVNGEVILGNVMLEGSFKGIDITLKDGFNKIDFEALNQGTSGPNTAQLVILDDRGEILGQYEWNLLTGNKATAIVVKP